MNRVLILLLGFLSFSASAENCSFKSHHELAQEIYDEIGQSALKCVPNSVHLTFDDGPSQTVTPEILKELKLRKIQASFFVTTTNLDPSHAKYQENRALVQQAMNEGHMIADHGFEHNAYDLRLDASGKLLEKGFSQKEREDQIQKSVDYLNWSTGGKFSKQIPLMFRFPYGRGAMPSEKELKHMMDEGEIHLSGKTYAEQLKEYRQISPPLQTIAGHGFSHLGWNHDSHDSSFGIKSPEKTILKDYIIKNIKALCSNPKITKVALFHDIKEMNITAIPIIADIGQCLGLKFVNAQTMMADQQLNKTGVMVSKQDIIQGQIENVIKGLAEVESSPKVECSKPVVDKSCWSEQYQKSYPHCSGGDSVCFEGKWYARTDPVVKDNCQLKD